MAAAQFLGVARFGKVLVGGADQAQDGLAIRMAGKHQAHGMGMAGDTSPSSCAPSMPGIDMSETITSTGSRAMYSSAAAPLSTNACPIRGACRETGAASLASTRGSSSTKGGFFMTWAPRAGGRMNVVPRPISVSNVTVPPCLLTMLP